jgi:DUF1009 family protein
MVVILGATLPEVGKGIVGLRKAWGALGVALVSWESGIEAKERHGRLDAGRATVAAASRVWAVEGSKFEGNKRKRGREETMVA